VKGSRENWGEAGKEYGGGPEKKRHLSSEAGIHGGGIREVHDVLVNGGEALLAGPQEFQQDLQAVICE